MKKYLTMAAVAALIGGQVWATALSANRNTPARSGARVSLTCETNQIIYAGAMVCVNSSGYAVLAADSSGYAVVGRALKKVDTRLQTSRSSTLEVDRGVFRWENADSIAAADIGKIVYVTDDQTVNKTGGGQNIIAGAVVDVDSDGVWVDTGKIGPIGASTPSSLACSGNATIAGTLAVTGAQTNSSTLKVGGAVEMYSTLGVTGLATLSGGATITEDVAITLDATDEEMALTTSSGAAKVMRIYCSAANPSTTVLLQLDYNANGDTDGAFLKCADNASADTKFLVDYDGNTTIAGTLGVTGVATFTATPVTTEIAIDGRYGAVGPDASTGVMIQTTNVTMHAGTIWTNTWIVNFANGSTPIVTASYTEDPGDVQPLYVVSSASNQCTITVTADKNFNIIAVGPRP